MATQLRTLFVRASAPSPRYSTTLRVVSQARTSTVEIDSWVVPREPASTYSERVAGSIRHHGFAVLPNLLDASGLKATASDVVPRADAALRALQETGAPIDVGSAQGFDEVVLRSPARYDVPHADVTKFPALNTCNDFVAAATGDPDCVCIDGGMVRALPGAATQCWHADSPHTTAEHGPPKMVNVLVALCDIDPSLGPTEVVPGSHRITNHLCANAKTTKDVVYQRRGDPHAHLLQAEGVFPPVSALLRAGDAVAFDDRTLHRGMGNTTNDRQRDVAWYSFQPRSFHTDTYFEQTRSLSAWQAAREVSLPSSAPAKGKGTPGAGTAAGSGGSAGGASADLGSAVRSEFPGLLARPGVVFADGAGGSQVHRSVVTAMSKQLIGGAANMGGTYASSEQAGAVVTGAREAASDLLGCAPQEVVFGNNTTTLAFHLARHIARGGGNSAPWVAGENVVLDPLSHQANVSPWVNAARAAGVEVRWFPLARHDSEDGRSLNPRLDVAAAPIDAKTRLVAIGAASNAMGTAHDIAGACARATAIGPSCISFVDAVHFVPHTKVDVSVIGCDFLACSPYKFFGPHCGILFGRAERLAALEADRLGMQTGDLPSPENCELSRWEIGTQNYEALAGTTAAVDYLASLGQRFGGARVDPKTRKMPSRAALVAAGMGAVRVHEDTLSHRFLEGASSVPGVTILGEADAAAFHDTAFRHGSGGGAAAMRTATFAVRKRGVDPFALAEKLSVEHKVWCTASNHYSQLWSRALPLDEGFDDDVGAARLSLLHYNTHADVDRILAALDAV
uniref:Aminotransferase class V domain-containing protein n=1 Tax=Noctiluca scintillans TaxID=2966 RepID=A0A7S1AS02_NOCSC|mmetsp:Transcript_57621/g.153440  ORF Transcript_57621/g.153440 Transcript_57621/m.153440 type:complete len:794 (+) Transcript_57621:92-2473(+)